MNTHEPKMQATGEPNNQYCKAVVVVVQAHRIPRRPIVTVHQVTTVIHIEMKACTHNNDCKQEISVAHCPNHKCHIHCEGVHSTYIARYEMSKN
jgi:hypothetical protein